MVSTSDDSGQPNRAAGHPADPSRLSLTRRIFDLPSTQTRLRYVICSTPRSGSTLLAELLRATGQMGVPAEYLDAADAMPRMARRYGVVAPGGLLDMTAYLGALQAHRTTANGVFGVKVHFRDLRGLLTLDCIRELLMASRMLWIRRRDVLGQAISLEIGSQTQQWSKLRGHDIQGRETKYSAKAISRRIAEIVGEESEWSMFLEANALPYHVVFYEDLLTDSSSAVHAAFALLGLPDPPPVRIDDIPIEKQGGDINTTWRRNFLSEISIRPPSV